MATSISKPSTTDTQPSPSLHLSPPQWTIFSLPLEIRLLIYHACLTRPIPISIFTSPSSELRKGLVPSLLLCSQQIHQEAGHILYANNTFVLDTKWTSLSFLQTIKTHNVSLIKNLTLIVGTDYDGGRIVNRIHYTGPLWCELLAKLASEARGLRLLKVWFAATVDEMGKYWGAGRDSTFFLSLTRVVLGEGACIEIEGTMPVAMGCRQLLEDRLGREKVRDISGDRDECVGVGGKVM